MANQATETKEKGQAQHGLLKGLIGVGALLGGTVMTNSDVFADTPVANEKGAAADNVIDQNTVMIPAGSTASSQSASTSTVSESTVTSTVATDKITSVSEHTAASEVTKASTSLAASATPGSTSTSANVGSQQVAGSTNESTSESGNTSAANASSTVPQNTNASQTNDQTRENPSMPASNTIANVTDGNIMKPVYPDGYPLSNIKDAVDFLGTNITAPVEINGAPKIQKIGSITLSMDQTPGSSLIFMTERYFDNDHQIWKSKVTNLTISDDVQTVSTIFGYIEVYISKNDTNISAAVAVIPGEDAVSNQTTLSDYTGKNQVTNIDAIEPIVTNQTITRIDQNGNSSSEDVLGYSGTLYSVNPGEVVQGYFSEDVYHNGKGIFSPFSKVGDTYTVKYDGVSVEYELISEDGTVQSHILQNNSAGTGTMTRGAKLKPGQIRQVTIFSSRAFPTGKITLINPYGPISNEVKFQYKKLGSLVVIGEDGHIASEKQYVNDAGNSESGNYPDIPIDIPDGYSFYADNNGNDVNVQDILNGGVPVDLGSDTIVHVVTNSEATSHSQMESESVATSESDAASTSVVESESDSVSESVATSESDAASTSVATSESDAASTSVATSESDSASTSVATSESDSVSTSVATSESDSVSTSVATSESDSASTSVATSES
ncbi:hypothetical protein, partial [Leuconostoc holzapfelii]